MAEVARLEGVFSITGIRESQSSLRSFDSALQSSASKAESAVERVEKSASGLGKSLRGIGESAAGVAAGIAGFSTAQQVMTTSIQGTIGAALGYEKAMNVMQATSQATDAQMRQISNTAKALGADNTLAGVSAIDAAAAMTELSRAGLSVTDTMSAAKGVLQLATAGQLENAEAASITAGALNAFGLAGSEATRVADLLAAAANASMADVRELGMGMSQAAAVFKNANQPVEVLVTSLAQMSQEGIKAQDASTSLKTAMLRLMAPTKEAAAVMDQYNINVRDAQGNMLPFRDIIAEMTTKLSGLNAEQRDAALVTMLGSDAIRAGQIVLTAGTEAYDKMAAAVGRTGAANELAAAQMKGAAGAIAAFRSQLETIGLVAGEKVLPHITTLMGGLSSLVTLFTNLPGPVQAAAAAVVGLGVAFLAFQASPAIAALTAITLGVTYLAGKLTEADAAQQRLNTSLQAAGASALMTYATALKNIETAGGGLAEKQEFLRGQVSALAIEYGRGNDALGQAISKYNELKGAHGESSVQAEAQKTIVTDLTQAQYNLAGSLQVARGAVADGGAALQEQATQAAAARTAIDSTAQAAKNAGSAASGIDPLTQAVNELFQSAEKTSKALRDLMNPPTGVEQQISGQLKSAEGAVKNFEAATKTAGQTRDDFIAQSKELLANANLEESAYEAAEAAIARYEQGITDGVQAQKELEAALKPSVDALSSIQDALSATRDAIAQTTEAEINAKRGWSDSMEERKSKLEEFRAAAVGEFPQVTAAAQTMAAETGAAIDSMADGAQEAGAAVPAGVAAGISAGTPAAVAAAQSLAAQVQAAMEGVLEIRSPSRKGWGVGRNYATSVGSGIEEGTAEAVDAAENLAFSIISPLERMEPTLRKNQQAIARLEVAIARLNEQLAYVEPHSEHEAALQSEIQTLEAWKNQIQSGLAILDAEARALELSKSALDGATEARSKFLQQQSDIARFGADGTEVMGGLFTALTENTAASGREAYAILEDFIEGLKETLGDRAIEAGNYLRFLFFQSLGAEGADREAALSRFEGFFEQLRAESSAKLIVSSQTMNSALTASLFDEATKARLGERAASVREAITQALLLSGSEGAVQAQESLADLLAGFETELRTLPASVQGPILAEYQAAMRAFADAPLDAGVQENLERVVSEAERMLAFIPKNLDKLAPEMRQAAMHLWEQVKTGLLSAEEATERLQAALSLIPQDMHKLGPEVRSEIQKIIDQFAKLGGSAEGAGDAIEMAMQRSADAAAATAERIAATQTEPNMLGLPMANPKSASTGGGGGGGGGGGANSKANAFAAAIASPGGWTPGLASAFFDGMDQIATYAREQRDAIFAGMRQMGDTMQNFDAVVMSSRGIFGGGEGATRSTSNFIPPDFMDFGGLMRDAANRGLTSQANLIAQRMYDGQLEIASAIAALQAVLGGKGAGNLQGIIDYGAIRAAVRDGVADALGGRGIGGAASADLTNTTRRTIA